MSGYRVCLLSLHAIHFTHLRRCISSDHEMAKSIFIISLGRVLGNWRPMLAANRIRILPNLRSAYWNLCVLFGSLFLSLHYPVRRSSFGFSCCTKYSFARRNVVASALRQKKTLGYRVHFRRHEISKSHAVALSILLLVFSLLFLGGPPLASHPMAIIIYHCSA